MPMSRTTTTATSTGVHRPVRRVAGLAAAALALGAGLLAVPASAATASGAAVPTRVVGTDTGPVRGTVDARTAAVPRHALRRTAGRGPALAAAPAAARARRRAADHRRRAALRAVAASPYGVASTSEDCLYLNVFAPATATAATPAAGDGVDPRRRARGRRERRLRPGAAGARQGVVVVTLNYRLGALGFLAHPALTAKPGGAVGQLRADGPAGRAALGAAQHRRLRRRPGQRHDLRRVGRRALERPVAARLAARRGAVHRAIVQSGALRAQQRLAGERRAPPARRSRHAAGCTDQTAACLRALPVSAAAGQPQTPVGYQPNVDGKVLTQSISTGARERAVQPGAADQRARTHDEWRLFVAAYDLVRYAGHRRRPTAQRSPTRSSSDAARARRHRDASTR